MESCQKAKPPFFALNIQPKSGQRGATTFLPPFWGQCADVRGKSLINILFMVENPFSRPHFATT